jgi:hypothetical protein
MVSGSRELKNGGILKSARLRDIASTESASVEYSPLGEQPYLLIELDESAGKLSAGERNGIEGWLQRQACPVVALSEEGLDHPLAHACDVVVTNTEPLQGILQNIERAPIAAMTLVQLLRSTQGLAIEPALAVESLAYSTLQAGLEFKHWLAERKKPRTQAAENREAAVLIDRRGDLLELRLNRPERLNVLSCEMRDALVEALDLAAADSSIQSVTVSAAGKCFSAGGDLNEFGEAPDPAIAHTIRSVRLPAASLARCAKRATFLVHGACIGAGIELAAFGVRVRAKPDAFFQLPEISFGLIPGAGGCVSIPRRIGRQRTAYLALSACKLDVSTALEWGLIDEIVEP